MDVHTLKNCITEEHQNNKQEGRKETLNELFLTHVEAMGPIDTRALPNWD